MRDYFPSNRQVRHRTFNALGELTAVMDSLNQTVFSANASDSYDASGNLVHRTDDARVQQPHSFALELCGEPLTLDHLTPTRESP